MRSFFTGKPKKPLTTTVLYKKLWNAAELKGLPRVEIDYQLPEMEETVITDSSYSIGCNLDYGGSEGIYLDLYAEVNDGKNGYKRVRIGTVKTLDESDDAMRAMAELLATFKIVARDVSSELETEYTTETEGYILYVSRRGMTLSECRYSVICHTEAELEKQVKSLQQACDDVLFVEDICSGTIVIR